MCVLTRRFNGGLDSFESSPYADSESGSVFGLITGDPDPVTPSRDRVVPVCNRDLFPADSPAHCLGAGTPILLLSSLFCGVLL